MNPYIFLISLLLFAACFTAHVIVWRVRYPKNRPKALFLTFVIAPAVIPVFFYGFYRPVIAPVTSEALYFSIYQCLSVYLLHYSISLAYILSYPAIEAVSPTLAISLLVGKASAHGLEYDDILLTFGDDFLLRPRIQDLLDAGLAEKNGNYISITNRGKRLAWCFIQIRRLLGLPAGKG